MILLTLELPNVMGKRPGGGHLVVDLGGPFPHWIGRGDLVEKSAF
jgi:hypothetical protein